MDEPLDRIAFLVNSTNRVRVLQTVTAAPQTRAELAAEIEVPRATPSPSVPPLITTRGCSPERCTCTT